ncbi:MAG: hypothetical protein LBE56_08390, partial [Tannerella sp.]|nr:hypothetical protein [Tannerella sp.]
MKKYLFITAIALIATSCQQQSGVWLAQAPADTLYTQINREGETVIPNGRIVRSMGKQVQVAPHPYGLALSSDGTIA